MPKTYIGAKQIKAWPLNEIEFLNTYRQGAAPGAVDAPGYAVEYADGYISWSPKDVFEAAYREPVNEELELMADGGLLVASVVPASEIERYNAYLAKSAEVDAAAADPGKQADPEIKEEVKTEDAD